MTLQADPTEEGYNSFASVEEATAYFADTYWPAGENPWEALDPDQQEALLVTATRRLSALPWLGAPLAEDQLVAFPRSYTSYEYGGATEVGAEANPQWLVALTCETARWTWEEGQRPIGADILGSIKSVKIGELSVTFADGSTALLPQSVTSLLSTLGSGYIDLRTGPRSMRMAL